MAALVQTLPPQTSTVAMLGRPSSSGGYQPHNSHGQMRNHQQPTRYNMPQTGYRGIPASAPVVPPYAFTSTPQLSNTNARPFALNTGRSISSPKAPHPVVSPSSTPASPTTLPEIDAGNRFSIALPTISNSPLLGPQPMTAAPKPSPDRYRRPVRRSEGDVGLNRAVGGSALPSGSGTAAVGSLYNHPAQSSSSPSLNSQQPHQNSIHGNAVQIQSPSADDLQLVRPQPAELATRYRRRSFGSIDTAGLNHASDNKETASPHPTIFLASSQATAGGMNMPPQPVHHRHTSSSDSITSSRSARSSRPGSVSEPTCGGLFLLTFRRLIPRPSPRCPARYCRRSKIVDLELLFDLVTAASANRPPSLDLSISLAISLTKRALRRLTRNLHRLLCRRAPLQNSLPRSARRTPRSPSRSFAEPFHLAVLQSLGRPRHKTILKRASPTERQPTQRDTLNMKTRWNPSKLVSLKSKKLPASVRASTLAKGISSQVRPTICLFPRQPPPPL